MTRKPPSLTAALLPAPAVLALVAAQPALGADPAAGGTEAYAKGDILYTFDRMDMFVDLDGDYHLVVSEDAANRHPEISELHVAIASDFAVHSNEIIDAVKMGPTGQVDELESDNPALSEAVRDLEDGKFRSLFARDAPGVRTMSAGSAIPIAYAAHGDIRVSGNVPVHHGAPGTVCGGGFGDDHTRPRVMPKGDFPDKDSTVNYLEGKGYHKVKFYATWLNYGLDYAKKASAYGCNNGEFRDQALIAQDGNRYHYRSQGPEVNPEVLDYDWPAKWWGAYVALWHRYN